MSSKNVPNLSSIIVDIAHSYPYLPKDIIYNIIKRELYKNTIYNLRTTKLPKIISRKKIAKWRRQMARMPRDRNKRRKYLEERNKKVRKYLLFQNFLTKDYDFDISSNLYDALNSSTNTNTIKRLSHPFYTDKTQNEVFSDYFSGEFSEKEIIKEKEINSDTKDTKKNIFLEKENYEEKLIIDKKKGKNINYQVKSISLSDLIDKKRVFNPTFLKKRKNSNGSLLNLVGIGDNSD